MHPLLDGVSLVLAQGERACIVGRNGAGKSTLLKIAAGRVHEDSGDVYIPAGVRVAFLPQEIPDDLSGTIEEIVRGGFDDAHMPEWEVDTLLDRTLEEMGLQPEPRVETLSAGMKRRVLLARELVSRPHVLMLDEPTNHLDIEAIAWMENLLRNFDGAVLFITHDRAFLQNVATRILDLDRGTLTNWDCDYKTYLVRKEEWLNGEAQKWAVFDKKLSQEEQWIRKGVQARRTRNEGRVRALKKMREAHRERRQRSGSVRMQIEEANRSGVKVISADNVTYAWDERPIIKDFSDVIERGDKIGIVGPNGAGKSTLLKLLLGRIKPDSGTLEHGTGLQVAYFDQTREQLVETETVQEAIGRGRETLEINGGRKHVIAYLGDFLFPPDRARSPVSMLSGGERNRLLLARLFTEPFNVLVMDEPTNDLDLETLELLEDLLVQFAGTLLLVSHDRAFLDNVVTDLLVLEGDGRVQEYIGGYQDYLVAKAATARETEAAQAKPKPVSRPGKTRKFLNRERRELESLPVEIEALEKESATLAAALANPKTYQGKAAQVATMRARITQIEEKVAVKFARWEELDALRKELEE